MTRSWSGQLRSLVSRARARARGATAAATPAPPEGPRRPPAGTRQPLETVRQAVDPAGVRDLVVICRDRPVLLGRRFQEWYPDARLTVLYDGPQVPAAEHGFGLTRFAHERGILRALASVPPADLIVDTRRARPAAVRSTFRRAFLALADGGRYVARLEPAPDDAAPAPGDTARNGDSAGDIVDDVRELVRRQGLPTSERRKLSNALELGLARALAGVTTEGDLLVLRKKGEHVLKLGVEDTRTALAARGVEPRVIARVPAERHVSASSIWSSDAALAAERLPDAVDVGELTCTVYADVLVAPRQVAVLERLLLPTSYFLPGRSSRRTRGMHYYGSDYSGLLQEGVEPEALPGTFYHLDNQIPGHYGHVITHDLSKLWAWDAALAEHPGLRLLFSPPEGADDLPAYTYELLGAYGIGRERVRLITGPVRVERLITATQAFQQPNFLSPAARDVWARVTAGLLPRAGQDPLPERVFVSRRVATRRRCLNGDEVERRFEDAGFVVVYPEDLSLPDQVRLFSAVPVVAGYAGSGLINTVFSAGPATRIVLASKSYWATNEYHIAAMYGGDLHYFWCDPVFPGGPGGSPDDAGTGRFHADYVFDVGRDGPALDALLASLGAAVRQPEQPRPTSR
ncbi:glycosyltransferase family 61 protein [Promicromonospora sukumoe]|uniref:glycosyltransferase family 61 protein n=1 Tax=Promicromonospora sukumoe TaxID=88382 RepID=UPI0037C51824